MLEEITSHRRNFIPNEVFIRRYFYLVPAILSPLEKPYYILMLEEHMPNILPLLKCITIINIPMSQLNRIAALFEAHLALRWSSKEIYIG